MLKTPFPITYALTQLEKLDDIVKDIFTLTSSKNMKRKIIAGIFLLGVTCILLFFAVKSEKSKVCKLTAFQFEKDKSVITVGSYSVHIGNPNSQVTPTVWEGPVSVHNNQTGSTCTVQTSGLIDRPLLSYNGNYLSFVTFSGSNFQVETVDLAQCKESFISQKVNGPITFTNGEISSTGKPAIDFPCSAVR